MQDDADLSFEDDGLFAVPDVDLASGSTAQDEPSPFNAKAILGKEYLNDDFYVRFHRCSCVLVVGQMCLYLAKIGGPQPLSSESLAALSWL